MANFLPMADSCLMASLCPNCMRMFEGAHIPGYESVAFESPATKLIDPRICRVCSIISSRHERFVKKYNSPPDLNLYEVRYSYHFPNQDDAGYEVKSVELQLLLYFTKSRKEVISLAAISVDTPSTLSLSRNLPRSTESELSINFLKSKLKRCTETHETCRRRAQLAHGWLPSRLLEIVGPELQLVRLRDRAELAPRPYFTLSHCWGDMKPLQLTAETEASLRAGIPIGSLPKTFRDAVFITNKFSVSYIWIDSLCIFQDNIVDWRREASDMCDLYSKGFCNIAATGAPNGSCGLFFDRSSSAETPFRVQTSWTLNDLRHDDSQREPPPAGTYEIFPVDQWVNDLERGPLNTRAWVMQERFLSTRVLHFSSSQVFWECLENTASEVFQDAVPKIALPFWFNDSQTLKRVFFQTKKQRDEEWEEALYKAWQVFVRAYSACKLSKASDKLVAIDGVVKLLSKTAGIEFVSGLWQSRLLQELCWQRDHILRQDIVPDSFRRQNWRAPTWSWASIDVVVHPNDVRHHIVGNCPKFRTEARIEAIDMEQLPSGQLQRASLSLRGRILHTTLVSRGPPIQPEFSCELICGNQSIFRDRDRGYPLDFLFDNPESRIHSREELSFLSIFSCECTCLSVWGMKNPTNVLYGLILRPNNLQKGQYERVGVFIMYDPAYQIYMENRASEEHRLTIV